MKIIAIVLLSLSTFPTFAGVITGKVIQINVRDDDGMHYFYLDNPTNDRAPCATNDYWVIKDENSAVGKAQLSLLLTAYSTDSKVKVKGFGPGNNGPYGTCDRDVSLNSQGEDVRVIILKK